MEDFRAEGLSAIGDGGQAAISLMPHTDGPCSWLLAGFKSLHPLEKIIH